MGMKGRCTALAKLPFRLWHPSRTQWAFSVTKRLSSPSQVRRGLCSAAATARVRALLIAGNGGGALTFLFGGYTRRAVTNPADKHRSRTQSVIKVHVTDVVP